MDPRRPSGDPALAVRAAHGTGVLSPPDSGHRWGLPEALFGFALGLLISVLAASVAEAVTGYKVSSSGPLPVGVIAANVAGLWVGLIGAALYASRRRGSGSLVNDFGYRVGAWWDLPLGAAVGLVCQYALVPLLYLPFESFNKNLSEQLSRPVHRDTGDVHTAMGVVVVLAFLALGAPLVEELFFRGLLLRALLGRMPAPAGIVISGLLFALAHFEAVQFAGLAAVGVVFGVLAWRTGRLGPSIGAHVAFNAAAVISVVRLH